MMREFIITGLFILTATIASSQQLLLLDRFNGNQVVNDSTLVVFNSDDSIVDITQYFTMKNNTDQALTVYLRKTVNFYADSTGDYYCFGIRCWDGDDSTNVAYEIAPGAEDYTFASHVTHKRRFDWPQPILPHGISSITYTVYDKTTFPEPVEASVTVIYDHTGVGVDEAGKPGEEEIVVFPNPATDWVTIKMYGSISGVKRISIYNTLGAVVRSFNYNGQDNLIRLSVAGCPPGLYIGKIVTEEGTDHSFRLQVTE